MCAALEGCRAQAGAIVSIDSWQAATLQFSASRMAVVLLAKRSEVQDAANALAELDAIELLPNPEPGSQRPLALRVVAVTDDEERPSQFAGLPVVSCQRFIAALQAALDTDEVWLDLACIAHSGGLSFGTPISEMRASPLSDDKPLGSHEIDEFLDELDLPALWTWQSVHDEGDFFDLVTIDGPCFARLSVQRSHTVLVPLHLTDLRSREFVVALASSLYSDLDHLLAAPGPVADLLGPKPVAVQLTVDSAPEVGASLGTDAVRIGWHADQRWLEVYLSGDVELAAASNLESFRTAIATAIAGAALLRSRLQPASSNETAGSDPVDRRAIAPPTLASSDKEVIERVAAAWNQAPLSLMAESVLTSPGLSTVADAAAPRLHASIQQRIRAAVVGDVPSGVFVGRDARDVLNSFLVPACLGLLEQLIGSMGGQDAVLAATAYLQHRLSCHLRGIDRTSFDLSGPWGGEHLASHLDGSADSLTSSLAAEIVLEVLLRSDLQRRGQRPIGSTFGSGRKSRRWPSNVLWRASPTTRGWSTSRLLWLRIDGSCSGAQASSTSSYTCARGNGKRRAPRLDLSIIDCHLRT